MKRQNHVSAWHIFIGKSSYPKAWSLKKASLLRNNWPRSRRKDLGKAKKSKALLEGACCYTITPFGVFKSWFLQPLSWCLLYMADRSMVMYHLHNASCCLPSWWDWQPWFGALRVGEETETPQQPPMPCQCSIACFFCRGIWWNIKSSVPFDGI